MSIFDALRRDADLRRRRGARDGDGDGDVDAVGDAVVEREEGSDAAGAPPPFDARDASNASAAAAAAAAAAADDDDEPEALCCPITKVMMRDPVFLAGSGNTYERDAIERFWRGSGGSRGRKRDPLTNARVANASLFTNWDKRREVQAWLSRNEGKVPEGWASRDDVPPAKETTDDARRRSKNGGGGGGGGARRWATIAVAFVVSSVVIVAFQAGAVERGWEWRRSIGWRAPHSGGGGGGGGDGDSGLFFGGSTNREMKTRLRWESALIERFGEDRFKTMAPIAPPHGSRIRAMSGPHGELAILIPPGGVFNAGAVAETAFTGAWTAITAAWTYGAMIGPSPLFALFSVPFWGVGAHLGKTVAAAMFESTRVDFVPLAAAPAAPPPGDVHRRGLRPPPAREELGRFHYSREAFGRELARADGPLGAISGLNVVTRTHVNDVPTTTLNLFVGVETYEMGVGVSEVEQRWMRATALEALARARVFLPRGGGRREFVSSRDA